MEIRCLLPHQLEREQNFRGSVPDPSVRMGLPPRALRPAWCLPPWAHVGGCSRGLHWTDRRVTSWGTGLGARGSWERALCGARVCRRGLFSEKPPCVTGRTRRGLVACPKQEAWRRQGRANTPAALPPHALCSGATLPSPSRPRSPHSWSPPHPDPRSSPHNQCKPPNWHHPRLGTSQSQGEVRRVVGVLVPGFPRSLGHGE